MSAPRRWRCKRERLIIADCDGHCFYVCYSGDIHSSFLTFGTATGETISPQETGWRSRNMITSTRNGAWGEIFSQPRSKCYYNFLMTTVQTPSAGEAHVIWWNWTSRLDDFASYYTGVLVWSFEIIRTDIQNSKEHCVRISVEKLKLKTLSEIISRMCLNSCFEIMISMYCVPEISSQSGSKDPVLAV